MERCDKCTSKDVVMVEYPLTNPLHYDGVSEYLCLMCGYRQGRWSFKSLKSGEYEAPFGGKRRKRKKKLTKSSKK